MTKLQKIQSKIEELNNNINAVSFERKDTSYMRNGGYFGTEKAITLICKWQLSG